MNTMTKTKTNDTADREVWLRDRKKGIGGSDVAAVLGLSPWRTARRVQRQDRRDR